MRASWARPGASPQPRSGHRGRGLLRLSRPGGQGATGGAAIAGRDKAELAVTLIAFRSNERPGTIMGRIARGYSDAEIAAIADFIARQR